MAAVKTVQLSQVTLIRWCEGMAVEEQLKKDRTMSGCLSSIWQVNQYNGCGPTVCFEQNGLYRHECQEGAPHHLAFERTHKKIFLFANKSNLPLFVIISVTADGTPAMTSHTSGFVALCKQNESFPDILNHHCIIHQQALCGKIWKMKEVMEVAMKTACSLRARSYTYRSSYLQELHSGQIIYIDT